VKNPTQPHTNTITNIASTPNPIVTGSLLALNENYIVYAVKNGLVRVLDRSSDLRTLLRGHKERISDVSFFESTSDVLASVSDGDCRIWRVFGREDELSSEILLEIQKDDASEENCSLERVIWHPFNPNQLVLLHQGSSVATFVETTRLMTTVSNADGQSHAVCQMKNDSNVDGMLKLIVTDSESDDSGICDLSWSNQDARHVLTAHKDGCVRLWDLGTKVYVTDGKEVDLESTTIDVASCAVSAKCLMTVKVSTGAQRCFFLQAFGDACSMFRKGGATAMEPGSYMTSPFVTYSTNGEVALWSPFTMSGSPPSIVRIFKLENEDAALTNVSVCTLPPVDDEKAPSVFVLLSDFNGNIHALHMASQWRDVPNSNVAPSRKIAAVTGFDYVVYFKSLQPIYSQNVITSLDDTSDAKQWNLDLYCVQSKAVQKLTLSPAMCLAPAPLEGTMLLPDGVVVEDIPNNLAATTNDAGEDIDFQDYEDIDEVDESYEEVVKKETVEAAPTPPLPNFLGGNDNSGAFSNWLGSLAGASKPKEADQGPEDMLPVVKSEVDLASVPLPEAPVVEFRSVSAPPKPPTPQLLSPMEILGMSVRKEEKNDAQPTKVNIQPEITKEEKKSTKKTKSTKSNDDKKITILKREDTSSKKTSMSPAESKDASATGNVGVTKDEIDHIVRKALSSHIQKHESIITAEIQKAVRYEVQSGLVPALNKTVAQTLEQTVSKTMKTHVSKVVKESVKANTAEIAASISSKIQEPLVDSFHKTMRDVMVPAYENGTRQMFEQVSSSIETGLELKKKESEETAKFMDSMVKRMDAMGKTIEVLIKAVAQLQTGPGGPAQSAPKSPVAPAVDEAELLRKKIVELLRANEFEKAFTHALSVSNSAMALFVCKHSDLSVVLESDTPKLSQPIMLCLMQQLGANLATDNDLPVKLAWLQSMALTLDPQNESIKKHISGVVQQLVVNLQSQMGNSDPALRRHLQMLLQVIRGLMA
jgi:WD40 repeat protein